MLSVEGLSKSYGRHEPAVQDLTFSVRAGSIVTLLGHNGAGKSTTLKVAAGILAPTSGRVTLDGVALDGASGEVDLSVRRRVGYLPEESHLLDYLTAHEFLAYVGELYGIDDPERLKARIAALVEAFAVERPESRFLGELSAGQRRRVSIAATLLNEPPLLLLDEPTNFLDPIGVKILKDRLVLARARGHAALVATHRLDIAEQLSDGVIVLDHGRPVFQGTIPQLQARLASRAAGGSLEELYTALVGN